LPFPGFRQSISKSTVILLDALNPFEHFCPESPACLKAGRPKRRPA
jgi:hypothetical protein